MRRRQRTGGRLSVAARVIGAVLAEFQPTPARCAARRPRGRPRSSRSAAALAGTLAQTVTDSGLFYESHLRRVRGRHAHAGATGAGAAGALGDRRGAWQARSRRAAAGDGGSPRGRRRPSPCFRGRCAGRAGRRTRTPRRRCRPHAPRPPTDADASDGMPPRAPSPPLHAETLAPAADAARVQAAYRRGEAAPPAAIVALQVVQRAEEATPRACRRRGRLGRRRCRAIRRSDSSAGCNAGAPAARPAGDGSVPLERPGVAGRADDWSIQEDDAGP